MKGLEDDRCYKKEKKFYAMRRRRRYVFALLAFLLSKPVASEIIAGFEIPGFPETLGAIDGTHIQII